MEVVKEPSQEGSDKSGTGDGWIRVLGRLIIAPIIGGLIGFTAVLVPLLRAAETVERGAFALVLAAMSLSPIVGLIGGLAGFILGAIFDRVFQFRGRVVVGGILGGILALIGWIIFNQI